MPISKALRGLLWERKQQADAALTERIWAERQRVKAAFLEGMAAGREGIFMFDEAEAWQHSDARANLYPGPPTPLPLAAKAKSRGYRLCDCRRPGGPGRG